MMTFTTLLEETLEAWVDARQGIIEEAENIPDRRFDFRPTPEVKSVTELIQHIIEVAELMTGELTRPDTNFHRAPWPELIGQYAAHVKEARGKAELLALLKSSLDEGVARFREAGELAMLQLITRFDDEIKSMLISASASTEKMRTTIPGAPAMPSPTTYKSPTSVSTS